MPNTIFPSGASRRFPVIIRLVALAALLQAVAFAEASAPGVSRSPDTVIYPKTSSEKGSEVPTLKPESSMGSGPYFLLIVVLAGAGGWLLWKRRSGEVGFGSRAEKKLHIEESRSLGNRQYLVVASYENRKFLLGVTSERIQLLTHLSDKEEGKG